jgi:hypothetical protein
MLTDLAMERSAGVKLFSRLQMTMSGPAKYVRALPGPRPNRSL